MERQLTTGPLPKDMDNNLNFSPDGRWLVFDCRGTPTGIGVNRQLGMVHVETGETKLFYTQQPHVLGVGAASFLNNREVIAIHALTSGLPYDFTQRGGMIVPIDGSPSRFLDSRDVVAPFTPGALRGGTHKHEPDATGRWVGFTYNDHVMKTQNGSDLRNVGVSFRGRRATVPADAEGGCFTGESFSVLLTACVEHPKLGSDEFRRAEGDCWIGQNGYLDRNGRRRRARAFRGLVDIMSDGKVETHSDVFVVDVPEDITLPGPLGPLEGTMTDYPKPPKGATVRRLTHTAAAADPMLRGVSGHLRTCSDGNWIALIGKTRRGALIEDQVFVVSPTTCQLKQVSSVAGGVVGDPRFSPNGAWIAVASSDGSVWTFGTLAKTWGAGVRRTPPNKHIASRIVISPDSTTIAYNREIDGVMQIFTIALPSSPE